MNWWPARRRRWQPARAFFLAGPPSAARERARRCRPAPGAVPMLARRPRPPHPHRHHDRHGGHPAPLRRLARRTRRPNNNCGPWERSRGAQAPPGGCTGAKCSRAAEGPLRLKWSCARAPLTSHPHVTTSARGHPPRARNPSHSLSRRRAPDHLAFCVNLAAATHVATNVHRLCVRATAAPNAAPRLLLQAHPILHQPCHAVPGKRSA